jgi:Fe2+ transport system protein FeoA
MPQIIEQAQGDLISLDQLPQNHTAVVVKVKSTARGLRKFADLGLVAGTLIEYEGSAPLGGLIRIKVMGSQLSMRKSDAKNILVKPVE